MRRSRQALDAGPPHPPLARRLGWTTDGLVEILAATRTAAQVTPHQEQVDAKIEALRRSGAAVEAALARYDEREERGLDRG